MDAVVAVLLVGIGATIALVSLLCDSVPHGLQGWGLAVGFVTMLAPIPLVMRD